jgi:hypothetical protein
MARSHGLHLRPNTLAQTNCHSSFFACNTAADHTFRYDDLSRLGAIFEFMWNPRITSGLPTIHTESGLLLPRTPYVDRQFCAPNSNKISLGSALVALSDGHAAQGDGEVCLAAVETSLKGEIQVIVHKGQRIGWPGQKRQHTI